MAKEVFLSYTWSKDDFLQIKKFHGLLEEKLREVSKNETASIFYDKDNITEEKTEEEFKPILASNLENSKVLVLLLSKNWLQSKWCNWEFGVFTDHSDRPIIPVLWEDIDLKKIEAFSDDVKKEVDKIPIVKFIDKEREDEVIEVLAKKIAAYL